MPVALDSQEYLTDTVYIFKLSSLIHYLLKKFCHIGNKPGFILSEQLPKAGGQKFLQFEAPLVVIHSPNGPQFRCGIALKRAVIFLLTPYTASSYWRSYALFAVASPTAIAPSGPGLLVPMNRFVRDA